MADEEDILQNKPRLLYWAGLGKHAEYCFIVYIKTLSLNRKSKVVVF